jgi:predicted MFS family arabinose efflux permease
MLQRPGATLLVVSTATGVSLLGDPVLYAVLPVYFKTLGLTALQVGVLLSANRRIRLLTNHLAHRIMAHVDARLLFAGAMLVGVLTTCAYTVTAFFSVLLAARIVWGLCWSFIRHIGVHRIMETVPFEAAGQTMGFYNGISRLGSVAGLFGGALLVDGLGYHAALGWIALVSCISVPLASFGPPGIQRDSADDVTTQPEQRGDAGYLARGMVLGAVGPGFVMSTLGVVLAHKKTAAAFFDGASAASLTGALLAIRYVLESAMAPVLGSVSDRYGVRRASTVCLVRGAALAVASVVPQLLLVAALVTAFFIASTALQAAIAGQASQLGSARFARYVTAADTGAAAGPLLGWAALEQFDAPTIGLMFGAACFVLVAPVAARLRVNGATDQS